MSGQPASRLWRPARSLVLASGSATRLRLLRQTGIPVRVAPPDIDEREIEKPLVALGADAAQVALHLATEKALVVSRDKPGDLILGADQTLSMDGRRFSKPADRDEAAEQLRALSGRTHCLHSAAVCARDGAALFEVVALAELTMRRLSDEFIETYLDMAGEAVLSSVGAYQVEALGVHLFERINGDHSAILGLPLLPLLAFLRDNGSLLS